MTREWIAVQEMWTDLSKAFAIKGFKDSIENGAGFEDLNKRYVSLCFLVIWTKSKRTATFFREAFPNRYEHPDVILASMHNKWEPFDNICPLLNTPTII